MIKDKLDDLIESLKDDLNSVEIDSEFYINSIKKSVESETILTKKANLISDLAINVSKNSFIKDKLTKTIVKLENFKSEAGL